MSERAVFVGGKRDGERIAVQGGLPGAGPKEPPGEHMLRR
jgi:hypothetical protein